MGQHGHIARSFVDARTQDIVLESYPGAMPASLTEAYAIQDKAISYIGRAVGGWKLGRINAPHSGQFGAERLAGPIFTDTIVMADADQPVTVPVLKGFAAAEAELLLQLGDVPPAGVTREQIIDYISDVRFGIEIASSPFIGINENGPAVTASDFGNNYGLVVGPKVENWREADVLNAQARVDIDGVQIGTGNISTMLDGPFGSVAFLASLMPVRGGKLAAGQWISTGAITGVHPVKAGQLVEAYFGDNLVVRCRTAGHTKG